MRAARITEWGGPLELAEVADPAPAAGEVRVRVEACGIGLTVVNCTQGQLGNDPAWLPRIPGHELVGVVDAVGEGVDPARVGERVVAYFYLVCGSCRRCLASQDSLCERFRGNVGVAIDGGYAEYAVLPALNALPVPAGVEPVAATTIPDAIATPVHVARRAGIGPETRVAVIGAGGGVGIHMAQVARAYGAEVVGLDVVAAKLAYLEGELGIPGIDSSDSGAVALPAEWHGKADVIVDLVGRPPTLGWALESLDRDGRLVCLTTFRDVEFTVSPRALVQSQLAVLGTRYNSRAEVGIAAELVRSGRVRPVVTRQVPLEGITETHDALRAGTLLGRGALVW
ncbi:MAG TPA: alcohol dehydrogenase catalytic domain-containing protein [Gaiellaceae bacterium]|nr:alcohol dehydrogenase catalytic domain-containing protein [Gaiellaceae bacterium]